MIEINRTLLWVYAAVNAATFVMYGVDKRKAKRDKWRIPESTLVIAAVFGVIGGLLGMLVFRHKTKKPKFAVGLPLIFIAEAAAMSFILAQALIH